MLIRSYRDQRERLFSIKREISLLCEFKTGNERAAPGYKVKQPPFTRITLVAGGYVLPDRRNSGRPRPTLRPIADSFH